MRSGDIIVLEHKTKWATVTLGAQVKALIEQRVKLMEIDVAALPKPQPTGTTERVGDYDTQIYLWSNLKSAAGTFWVAKNFPDFQAIKADLSRLRKIMNADGDAGNTPDISELPGMVVKTQWKVDKTVRGTIRLVSAREEPVNDSRFEIPAGYRITTNRPSSVPPQTDEDKDKRLNVSQRMRLGWNIETLVRAYEGAGHTNELWDAPAKRALFEFARRRSHVVETNEPCDLIIITNCNAALAAGCDDPFVRYVKDLHLINRGRNTTKALVPELTELADQIEASTYPPIRKFYIQLRATRAVWSDETNSWPIEKRLRTMAMTNLLKVLDDETTPPQEVSEACLEMLAVAEYNWSIYTNCYAAIKEPLFAKWRNSSAAWFVKGEVYIAFAWKARGSGYAKTVKGQGWEDFADNLAIAQTAFESAWHLSPRESRIPARMIEVGLGQSKGRQNMEAWFTIAMQLNPNDYEACQAKLRYLEPKWNGSTSEMMAFGLWCLHQKHFGGKVPLILVRAHETAAGYVPKAERANYWKRPDVWVEVKEAYTRYLELNPDDPDIRALFARDAYKCEAWDDLNHLITQLSSDDAPLFGGKEAFDKMLLAAKEHASSK